MVGTGHIVGRDIGHKLLLYFQRCIVSLAYQSHTVAYPVDMRVNSHGSPAKPHGLHDVCRLASYARQLHKVADSIGHLTAKIGDYHPRHLYKMP